MAVLECGLSVRAKGEGAVERFEAVRLDGNDSWASSWVFLVTQPPPFGLGGVCPKSWSSNVDVCCMYWGWGFEGGFGSLMRSEVLAARFSVKTSGNAVFFFPTRTTTMNNSM